MSDVLIRIKLVCEPEGETYYFLISSKKAI